MSALFVRLADRDDIAAVDGVLARSYPRLLKNDYPPSVLVTALPLISRAQPGLITCGSYFVAVSPSGQIIGAGGWTPRRGVPGQGDVRHLATDDRHVRRGVGRALMAAIHGHACAAGITHMDCKATRTAVPFYAAMGYRRVHDMTVDLRAGIGFPAVRMERDFP